MKIPVVLIIGGKEMEEETVTLKDMKAQKQFTVKQGEALEEIRKILERNSPEKS
ncbi:MAG: His/Gly/Thr/Pro-type tRNA ligase C-terminal domain-containing protein [Vulcanimicrobiota bacterium]